MIDIGMYFVSISFKLNALVYVFFVVVSVMICWFLCIYCYLRDLITYAYYRIAVLMVYTGCLFIG
jgi:DNA repair photolyase